MENCRTPYRIVVFSKKLVAGKRSKKYTELVQRSYAFDAWREEQSYQEARLPGAGSFLYPGIFAVRTAALQFLAQPEVHQVSIRTNQDKKVYLFNKHADGSVSGYRPE
jgi:hypothetical protein